MRRRRPAPTRVLPAAQLLGLVFGLTGCKPVAAKIRTERRKANKEITHVTLRQ